jgi:hypothetical protein
VTTERCSWCQADLIDFPHGIAESHKVAPADSQDCPGSGYPAVMTPGMMRGVPNTPGTPRRTIRVPDGLWEAAQAKAGERGDNLSDVIRRALERYVRRR